VKPTKMFLELFSGAGGMSHGFNAHTAFRHVGAYDAEIGKPSSRSGALACNATFRLNHAIESTESTLEFRRSESAVTWEADARSTHALHTSPEFSAGAFPSLG
jgi:hypothetical protein